jgi:hypothetical protein
MDASARYLDVAHDAQYPPKGIRMFGKKRSGCRSYHQREMTARRIIGTARNRKYDEKSHRSRGADSKGVMASKPPSDVNWATQRGGAMSSGVFWVADVLPMSSTVRSPFTKMPPPPPS